MLFKVSDLDLEKSELIAAESLNELKEAASEELGFSVVKIVRYPDGVEIKKDAILKELSKTVGELHLIGLAEDEEFEPESSTVTTRFKSSTLKDSIVKSSKTKDSAIKSSTIKDSVLLTKSSMDSETSTNTESNGSKIKSSIRSESEYMAKPDYIPKKPLLDLSDDEDEDVDQVENFSVLKGKLANFKRDLEKKPKKAEPVDDSDDEESKTVTRSSINKMSTKQFEQEKKEKQEKVKKAEEAKRKYEERMAELKTIDESLIKAENEKEELKKRVSEKKKEISRIKMQTKTEIELAKSDIADLELKGIELKIKKARISLIFKEFAQAEKVDLCFLVDCTGSMGSYINEAKMVIHNITDKLKKSFDDFSLRCAFVGYRDIDDGKDRTTVLPFTSSNDTFKSFVNGVKAMGGADQCEDVFGGLEEVNKLEWKNMSRVLFHIADAPCHGNRFHEGALDSYPGGDPRGQDIKTLMQKLKDDNVNYYFAEINKSTIKMIEEFNKEMSFVYGNPITVVKMESAADMTETVTTAVSSTIHSTKSMSMATIGEEKKIKDIRVDKKALTWTKSGMKKEKAELMISKFDGDLDDVRNKETIKFDRENVEIYVSDVPFAKGEVRYAYSAVLIRDGKEIKCVVKETILDDIKSNSFEAYKDFIECQLVAEKLSDVFLKEYSKSAKSIQFLHVDLLLIHRSGKYYTIEEYIGESFKKWSNNAGFTNEKIYANTLDAFSHWTYHITDSYLLVSDLQGFVSGTEYILTDPAICSTDYHRFSNTNLGKKGIKKYFEKHKCNEHCVAYGLAKHADQPIDIRVGGTKIKK